MIQYPQHKRTTRTLRRLTTLLLACLLAVSSVSAYEIDSTSTRDVTPIKTSLGHKLLKIPSLALGTPVYVMKGATAGILYTIYKTPVKRLFSLSNPIMPFFVIGGYTSNKGLIGGMGYRLTRHIMRDDKLRVKLSLSTNDYQKYRLTYDAPFVFSGQIGLQLFTQYQKRTRESFYNIGPDSRDDDEASFGMEESILRTRIDWRIESNLTLSLNAAYTSKNIFDGEDTTFLTDIDAIRDTFGLSADHFRATRYSTVGLAGRYDWRNHSGRPTSGGLLDAFINLNRGRGISSDLRILDGGVDLSYYVHLFRRRVLALRLVGRVVDDSTPDKATPFHMMNSLGGHDLLRGFRKHRFIDNDLVAAQVEYRYPVWDIFDAFLFLDEGRVFSNASKERLFENWEYSWGMGLRAFNADGLFARTTIGRSKESTQFYLDLGVGW